MQGSICTDTAYTAYTADTIWQWENTASVGWHTGDGATVVGLVVGLVAAVATGRMMVGPSAATRMNAVAFLQGRGRRPLRVGSCALENAG